MQMNYRVVAEGLHFPEGPCVLDDGSVAIAEVESSNIVRVTDDGKKVVIATLKGGPCGLALGSSGHLYACVSGGFKFTTHDGITHAVLDADFPFADGRIDRVDPTTGKVEILYTACEGELLRSPNDIVFDKHGGFYFTDLGRFRKRQRDHGAVYYAKADGSSIVEVAFKLLTPNGIGLSPDGDTLYVAETETGRLWAFDLEAPGTIRKSTFPSRHGGRLLADLPSYQRFDSLAVDGEGNVCVATLVTGCISVFTPDGKLIHQVKTPDSVTTNICFGGADLKTAYVTCSSHGKLLAYEWDRPGLKLNR